MNYIKQIQADLAARSAELDEIQKRVAEFEAHLGSQKFQGVDLDGSRKDWIATSDVIASLRNIRSVAC